MLLTKIASDLSCVEFNSLFFIYYAVRFYFPCLSLLAQPVNITLYGPGLDCLFSIRFRNGTCIIILDKKYNIANSSCHFGSYGSIWTGPSPKKYYMDLASVHIIFFG